MGEPGLIGDYDPRTLTALNAKWCRSASSRPVPVPGEGSVRNYGSYSGLIIRSSNHKSFSL
jgi:hypothetical protein